MLAKCVLASPASGHHLRWREILKLVKSRLKRWEDGDLLDLWSEAVESSQAQVSHRKHPTNLRKQKAKRAAQNGQYLTSEGTAPADEMVLKDMLSKHPQVPSPGIPPGPTPSPIKLSESTVSKGVKSFPPGSAPAYALATSVRLSFSRHQIMLLFSLTSLVASGRAPPTIVPHLCGATLIAIRKKCGGLRPIANLFVGSLQNAWHSRPDPLLFPISSQTSWAWV